MSYTNHQWEIEDSEMSESPEQKLIIPISGSSQLNALVLCLKMLPTHFFYVFSVSHRENDPDFLDIKILSRSGPMLYFHLGKNAAITGCSFLSNIK